MALSSPHSLLKGDRRVPERPNQSGRGGVGKPQLRHDGESQLAALFGGHARGGHHQHSGTRFVDAC